MSQSSVSSQPQKNFFATDFTDSTDEDTEKYWPQKAQKAQKGNPSHPSAFAPLVLFVAIPLFIVFPVLSVSSTPFVAKTSSIAAKPRWVFTAKSASEMLTQPRRCRHERQSRYRSARLNASPFTQHYYTCAAEPSPPSPSTIASHPTDSPANRSSTEEGEPSPVSRTAAAFQLSRLALLKICEDRPKSDFGELSRVADQKLFSTSYT